MGSDDIKEPLAPGQEDPDEISAGAENPNKAREAFLYCLLGVCFSIGVSVWIRYDQSDEAMMEFYAGYMVEMSLSLDNLFAFYLVFKYFKVRYLPRFLRLGGCRYIFVCISSKPQQMLQLLLTGRYRCTPRKRRTEYSSGVSWVLSSSAVSWFWPDPP